MMKDSVEYQSNKKQKVVFVLGCTATGKSKLSVDMASFFPSEIINSDKIQFYKGLDVVTNKITDSDRRGIRHHLLGFVEDPDADLTPGEFCRLVEESITQSIKRENLPIIVGGSNSYIEALVENPINDFRSKYECLFIWIDVSKPVLFEYIATRVDQMVDSGLVEEVRGLFVPGADYGRGIRRAIGVPEMDAYFRAEKLNNNDEDFKEQLLKTAIEDIKNNTCKLALRQFGKIQRLRDELGWGMHRVDATAVFEKTGEEAADEWMNSVLKPTLAILGEFLKTKHDDRTPTPTTARKSTTTGDDGVQNPAPAATLTPTATPAPGPAPAAAAANRGYNKMKKNNVNLNAVAFGVAFAIAFVSLFSNWIHG